MRTETESQQVDVLARELLKRRGITQPSHDEYADAAEIAAEAVARGKTTVAEVLAIGASNGAEDGGDETMRRILSKFAVDGRFVGDLSLTEQELLEAAVAAQERDRLEAVVAAEAEALCPHGYPGGASDGCPDCM